MSRKEKKKPAANARWGQSISQNRNVYDLFKRLHAQIWDASLQVKQNAFDIL